MLSEAQFNRKRSYHLSKSTTSSSSGMSIDTMKAFLLTKQHSMTLALTTLFVLNEFPFVDVSTTNTFFCFTCMFLLKNV